MAKVTKITQQKNDPNRYSVFIDGEYRFGLSAGGLIESGLSVGQELTPEELAKWEEAAGHIKLMGQALNYLSYKGRTAHELKAKLKQKGASEDEIENVSAKLEEQQLLDDAGYSQAWVSERLRTKQRSKRQLAAELRRKGVDGEIAAAALAEVSTDDELQALKALIEKKRHLSRYQDEKALMRYLAGQGFGYDQIKRALEELEI